MVERRDKVSTEGRGLGHSFAADNVERGEPDADFVKRRPTYPIGDDPRGREIDFEDTSVDGSQSYGSRNPVFRAYRGQAPLKGQEFGAPSRISSLDSASSLRPELPPRSVNTTALDAAKVEEDALLAASDFSALFPTVSILSPAPGTTYSPGNTLQVDTRAAHIRSITAVTLQINNVYVERKSLDRREQDVTKSKDFTFLYTIPADINLGPLDITVRAFSMNTSSQAVIADDAPSNSPEIDQAVGTLDGRIGQLHGTSQTAPKLQKSGILRTPEAVSSITVLVV